MQVPEAQTPPEPRRWYSIAPDPDLPPLDRRRAYLEVLGVYLAFFAAPIVAAALILGSRSADLRDNGSWGIYMTSTLSVVSYIGLAVVVVLLLLARRGVSRAAFGLTLPRRPDGTVATSQTIRIAGWCFFAILVGVIVTGLLETGHLPTEHHNVPETIFSVFDAAQAGVVEEFVALGFVVVTLRQAGRPWWEVTTVALVLRGAYHIYYGPGVFGILIWAALYYWIYLRFRTLVPLIVCHALWDTISLVGQSYHAVAGIGVLGILALFLTSVILWLIDRNHPPAVVVGGGGAWPSGGVAVGGGGVGVGGGGFGAGGPEAYGGGGPNGSQGWNGTPIPPQLPPPGWHPDPSGANRWRWWDGQRWTEHVSQHSQY